MKYVAAENETAGSEQRRHRGIEALGSPLVVAAFDQDGAAAGCSTRIDISPPIADHHRCRQIDAELRGRVEEHARLRLAAGAGVGIRVIANFDLVERKGRPQMIVHRFDNGTRLSTCADVRLIGRDDEMKAGGVQQLQRLRDAWQNIEILEPLRRIRLPAANDGAIDDAIAIDEDGSLHAPAGPLTDSHLAR